MLPRRKFLAVVALLALALAGCGGTPSPEPSPTPTRTGFATEQEAFAAAEQTYRAYMDESAAADNGDAGANPRRYLTRQALEEEDELASAMERTGLHFEGATKILSVRAVRAALLSGAASAVLSICLDGSEHRLINQEGQDVTPQQEPRFALRVEFASARHAMEIVRSELDEGVTC
jgi:hypothetical protein